MKLFFEEYEYPVERIKDTFESGLYSTSRDGDKARLNAVGYYYSTKVDDSVFILPKVFLFEEEKEIGEDGEKTTCISAFKRYDPLKIIDIDSESNPLKDKGDDAVIFELSTWIYLAIKQYNKRNENNRIVEDNLITNVKSTGDHHGVTYLDIILSLRKFNKEHRHLFTFISIINSRGQNKINWRRTINNVHPVIQNNLPFYLEYKTANKIINYDEELIVLFYSVLEYLKIKFRFKTNINLNYNLIRPSKIQSLIEMKKGTRTLKRIRHKFFKDELVALWKLLYTFFDKSEQIAAKNYSSETLLARQFNNVFEDMIDMLLSDYQDNLPDGLKDQPDGKRVDHIYWDQSLLDDSTIYYIGDSKYYKDTTSLGESSIYKQFTYAKNVIQINLNIYFSNQQQWDEHNGKQLRYRDDLTEGYNITPNFFIRGNVDPDNLTYTEHLIKPELENGKEIIRENFQFKDRLFDRDTLFTKEYNINFLYVLSAYAANADNQQFRKETRDTFRNDIIKLLSGKNGRFKFFILEPKDGSLERAMKINFHLLHGKVYRPSGDCEYLVLAREKIALAEELKKKKDGEIVFTLEDKISPYFYRYEYNLGEDVDRLLKEKQEARQKFVSCKIDENFVDLMAAEPNPSFNAIKGVLINSAIKQENIKVESKLSETEVPESKSLEEELVLVGCFNGDEQLKRIINAKIYYTRTGSRPGSLRLVPGYDACKYLFLHYKQHYMMFKLKGVPPRLFTSQQLIKIGLKPIDPDDFYLAFDLDPNELTKSITFQDIDLQNDIQKRLDERTVNIEGIGNSSTDSYFTTLKELFAL